MSGVIYLMQGNGELIEMNERGYDTEDLLQGYLADHPNLLAGDQINDAEPRRWLLISREMGVPYEEGGGDRWSADHLFLDQDAVPTIVEVKRSTDTRARREVVAQMLDYSANGVSCIGRLKGCTLHSRQTAKPANRIRKRHCSKRSPSNSTRRNSGREQRPT